MSQAVWFPSESYQQSTRMFQWMKRLGISNYDEFHEKSVDNIAWFWDEAARELGIEWSTPYNQVLDLSKGIKYPKWFVDGKMNIVYNAVEKWANDSVMKDQKAIIWESDDGKQKVFTFYELNDEVSQVANGLQKLGVTRGDIVVLYLPMISETVISLLAIAKMGAIVLPVFSGYGAEAVATRVNAAKAKYLITADGYYRRGKVISMKEEADRACSLSPTIEKKIIVKRTNQPTSWNNQTDLNWDSIKCSESPYPSIETSGDDPVMLLYTSGTTGKPKGAVHTHAGFPIKAAFDAGICMDVKKGDTLFWYTDMGWMMGPFLVFGGLINGASIVLFEGTPDYPTHDRIWEVASKHHVTHLGISPTLIRSLMKYGIDWLNYHDLSKLRLIGSTGEPWNPEPWNWLFEHICKRQIPIFNYSGGTEISGGIFGNVLLKPISPVTFNTALPGMDVHIYNSSGQSVLNEVGELVIVKPWVGMTNGFWNENDRYELTYWNRFPDTWVHGDWVIKDQEGFWTITGRSDDVLNVAGKRLGPAEMESIFVEHADVLEAGVIGVPDPVKGEAAIGFVVLKNKSVELGQVKKELLELVSNHLGKALLPKEIYFVEDLPKTRNAKVMRRVIKSAFLNEPSGDLSSLENPDAVHAIATLCKVK